MPLSNWVVNIIYKYLIRSEIQSTSLEKMIQQTHTHILHIHQIRLSNVQRLEEKEKQKNVHRFFVTTDLHCYLQYLYFTLPLFWKGYLQYFFFRSSLSSTWLAYKINFNAKPSMVGADKSDHIWLWKKKKKITIIIIIIEALSYLYRDGFVSSTFPLTFFRASFVTSLNNILLLSTTS